MADPVSPTGQAVFPQWAAKLGLSLAALGSSVIASLQFLPDDLAWKGKAMAGATLAIGLGAFLAGGSPGLRKVGTDAAAKVETSADAVNIINKPPNP